MNRTFFSRIALLAICVMGAGSARADHFNLDPVHSFVSFRAGHIGLGYVFGRFNQVGGSFEFTDDSTRALSAFAAQVKTETVDTNKKERDLDLRDNYFEYAKFPLVAFKASTIKVDGSGSFIVGGDLSLHGVTKSIAVKLKKRNEGKDPWGGYRLGLYGSLVVKRTDYGMTKELLTVDDEVVLELSFEGVRQ